MAIVVRMGGSVSAKKEAHEIDRLWPRPILARACLPINYSLNVPVSIVRLQPRRAFRGIGCKPLLGDCFAWRLLLTVSVLPPPPVVTNVRFQSG